MLGSAILCFLRHSRKYLARTYVNLDSYSYETQASSWCLHAAQLKWIHRVDRSHENLQLTQDDCNSRTHEVTPMRKS